MRWRGWLLALVPAACAGRPLAPHGDPAGNLLALTARQGERVDRRAERRADPLVVLVERSGLRAVDPVSALQRWSSPLEVAGHPAANSQLIFVPLSGHRLAAIDRRSGQSLWTVELPGEALSGLSANETSVVATVLDGRRGRSRVVGLAALDGQVRWMRRSRARFGAPAVVGAVVLVPVGGQVVALGMGTGRERARLDLGGPPPRGEVVDPAVERVMRREDALLAGVDRSWVDLRSATGGQLDAIDDIEGYGQLFTRDLGLDGGHGDGERLRLWVDLSATNAGHRSAVFLCRRAVVALRVDDAGLPSEAQWSYVSKRAEFVGFAVRDDRVVLVREDGMIVQLSRADGAELDRIGGVAPTRGALMLDLPAEFPGPRRARPQREQRLAMMRDLILDEDPRLLPAQKLAVELLWRSRDAEVRAAVGKIAHGSVRKESSAAAHALRAHAALHLVEPWGDPDAEQLAQLRRDLAARPSFLNGVNPAAGVLARRAVAAGDVAMIGDLVELLMHPGTRAGDLEALVDALGELGTPQAVAGVVAFLTRYHADETVLNESAALIAAVDVLVATQEGQATLREIVGDPFTAPALRDYIHEACPRGGC